MFQLMIFIKAPLRLRRQGDAPGTPTVAFFNSPAMYRLSLTAGHRFKALPTRNVSGFARPPQTAICDECATGIASLALTHIVTNPRALYVSSPLSLGPGIHGIKSPRARVALRQLRSEGHSFPHWSFGESLDWLLQHIHRAGIHGGGPVPLPLYRTRQPQGLPLGDAWSTISKFPISQTRIRGCSQARAPGSDSSGLGIGNTIS